MLLRYCLQAVVLSYFSRTKCAGTKRSGLPCRVIVRYSFKIFCCLIFINIRITYPHNMCFVILIYFATRLLWGTLLNQLVEQENSNGITVECYVCKCSFILLTYLFSNTNDLPFLCNVSQLTGNLVFCL